MCRHCGKPIRTCKKVEIGRRCEMGGMVHISDTPGTESHYCDPNDYSVGFAEI